MTVKGKEAHDWEKIRAENEHEWPQELKDAAKRVQLSLNVANSKNFKQSKVMMDGLAEDFRVFLALMDKWQTGKSEH